MTKFKIPVAFFSICLIFNFFSSLSSQSLAPIYQKGSAVLVADLTIGGDTTDENSLLNRPSKVVVDSYGNILVLDSGEDHIKKFDATGKYITTIGRRGRGPGELMQCYNMTIDENDNIITWDFGNRRFTFFNSEGKHLKTLNTTDIIEFPNVVFDFKVGRNGVFYIQMMQMDHKGEKGGTLYNIYQFSPDLKIKKEIISVRIRDNSFISKPIFTNVPIPYHPRLLWNILPSGNIVVTHSEDYSIKIFSADLKLLHDLKHQKQRMKITEKDKEMHFAGLTFASGSSESGIVERKSSVPDYIRKATEFPKFKPYFRDMFTDHEGNILIQTFEMIEQNYNYDVFSPEGKFINRVTLPTFDQCIIYRGFIYQVKGGEDEFPAIVRYRLQ